MFPLWIETFSSVYEMDVQRHISQKGRHLAATLLSLPWPILFVPSHLPSFAFEGSSRTAARAATGCSRSPFQGGTCVRVDGRCLEHIR
jgi:hypothetical protein